MSLGNIYTKPYMAGVKKKVKPSEAIMMMFFSYSLEMVMTETQ